jgi:beta-mannosidase
MNDTVCAQTISLAGDWQLRWYDGQRGDTQARILSEQPEMHRALLGRVPGSVHLDLMRAGLLDDPNTGLNVLKARWVEENFWHYRRAFTAPALAEGERAYLYFEALDLVAAVYLNGQEVGRHANAFYPCRLDVTAALRAGENTLLVTLEAGLYHTADRPSAGYGMNPCDPLHKRNWLRTTQSTFAWDWSPLLLNIGIRGGVRLEICRAARLETLVALAELSPDLRKGQVTARLFVEGLGAETRTGLLSVEVDGQVFTRQVQVQPGLHPIEVQAEVADPRLWWPVNHGEQALYSVSVSLELDGQVFAAQRRVGFRRVEVDQSKHPLSGSYFIIKVNGKPIFCKGGNLVPADLIFARIDRERYAMLVDRALESNSNLLRVWGGGLYESDDFYALCDEKGILVWQEFIFACAKYPTTDEAFLADIKREAAYQVRRLACHPSLVAWCGNNELEWGNWGWGYEKGVAHPDYALFHFVLPRILRAEDGTRYYQPSSPFSPDLGFPNADEAGDQHPWSVGFHNIDFRDYRAMACRFPNEGGFLGPTALPTMRACLEGAGSSLTGSPFDTLTGAQASFAWETHENAIAYVGDQTHPDRALRFWLGKDPREMTLETFTYYSGLVQGMALEDYIRNFRRRMFDSASAIFWMYNDVWPATRSWTIVDYYGRRTPAFHPVRRAFQPLRAALAVEGDRVLVYGVNEGPAWNGELYCGLTALAGGMPLELCQQASLPANASVLLAEFPLETWKQHGVESHAAFARLCSGVRLVSQDVLLLPTFAEMSWPKAEVILSQTGDTVTFTSASFAWRVCIDLDGELPLPDNFFDLLPGIPYTLPWSAAWGQPKIVQVGNLS